MLDWPGHECPEPFPATTAQRVYDALVYPGAPPIHPRLKARLTMSWRAGFIRARG